ncbi:MAG: hypothetical protein WC627_10265 [Legionella sp.]|jgi:hypothetical protein
MDTPTTHLYGKELASKIVNQAQTQKLTEKTLLSLVTDYFSSKEIKSPEEKSKIIQRSLIVLHPDKFPLTDVEQTHLITKTLITLKEQFQSLPSQNTDKELDVFFQKLHGSVFQNSEIEQNMAFLGYKNPLLRQWLMNREVINSSVQFLQAATDSTYSSKDMSNLLNVFIKIALLEEVSTRLHPGKSMHEVIKLYISSAANYQDECRIDPLFWLMNEIVINNTFPDFKTTQQETAIDVIESPSLVDILNTVLIYQEFSDIDSVNNLLENWTPDNYLPIVKALLTQLTEYRNEVKQQNYTNRLVKIGGESVFLIDIQSKNPLLQYLQLDKATLGNANNSIKYDGYFKSYLYYLENTRASLFYCLEYIPSVLFSAKFQLTNGNQTHSLSNCTIGEFLINRSHLLNSLINQERENKGLILEDPTFQPVIETCDSSVLTYTSSKGGTFPYYHTTFVTRNSQTYKQKIRNILDCNEEWIPESANPEVTSILSKTMSIFDIAYRGSMGFMKFFPSDPNPYGAVKNLFINCSPELRNSAESKALLLLFSNKAFKDMDPKLHHEFSEYVNKYIEVDAPSIQSKA